MSRDIVDNWFTVREIDNTTYIISEYGHPQEVHSFLLIGKHSAGLIDTGLGIYDIKGITDALTGLPVKLITTHAHFDHIGSHGSFDEIYIHKAEAGWLQNGLPMPIEEIRGYLSEGPITKPLPESFDINGYVPFRRERINPMEDGDIIDLGGRSLKAIHTPGHSPGHICVLDESRGYLFTGDLIYKGTLYAFLPESDPFLYRDSIRKLAGLENIEKILPSHNDLPLEHRFIQEVLEALNGLDGKNLLKKGAGIFRCNDFNISL